MSKLFVVGIGPGSKELLTSQAVSSINNSDVIVGYTVYVDLIKDFIGDKEVITTPMKKEIDRCKIAVDKVKQGYNVAMVCSGDAGVYGMAAPILELASDIDVEIIPGVTAALSGASLLGAPINHDFCIISLSDLLTPFEVIENRLKAAILGDFAIVLYNPSSHKRKDYLKRACNIMINNGAGLDRQCGYVKNIFRDNQELWFGNLQQLSNESVDMFTTVFIGNSKTKFMNNKMITERGYSL